ncbi:hypothetical protein HK103_001633 [Boothiomyces macroporosus]|uniref:SAM domain-containing protein n=1 Tax=Boothiomyces macroporosus TaxID=261099 RepID=A0AAD5UB36_9FUNG|nr:hypothetical protein HK103_001633 [Boothiomyces macroporosus]
MQNKLNEFVPGALAEWGEKEPSTGQLTEVKISETLPGFKRENSSGNLKVAELRELSLGASAQAEFIKELFQKEFQNYVVSMGGLVGFKSEPKHITVIYKDSSNTKRIDISPMSLESLKKELSERFNNVMKSSIKCIYLYENGRTSIIDKISDFEQDKSYFVLTDIDDFPPEHSPNPEKKQNFSKEMEKFFEKLRIKRKLDEDKIGAIKQCFSQQAIEYEDLIATGELALTDAKLKEIGISQLGLRNAILAVIKNNQ